MREFVYTAWGGSYRGVYGCQNSRNQIGKTCVFCCVLNHTSIKMLKKSLLMHRFAWRAKHPGWGPAGRNPTPNSAARVASDEPLCCAQMPLHVPRNPPREAAFRDLHLWKTSSNTQHSRYAQHQCFGIVTAPHISSEQFIT